MQGFDSGDGMHWERQFPCHVEASGQVAGRSLSWKRTLSAPEGRTTYGDARQVKDLAAEADQAVRDSESVTLPLISYYSTGRLWNVPREQDRVKGAEQIKGKAALSRLEARVTGSEPGRQRPLRHHDVEPPGGSSLPLTNWKSGTWPVSARHRPQPAATSSSFASCSQTDATGEPLSPVRICRFSTAPRVRW